MAMAYDSCPAVAVTFLVYCFVNHGLTTLIPQLTKSFVLRVAKSAPRERAIAAIIAQIVEGFS